MSINVEALKQMIRVLRTVQQNENQRAKFHLDAWTYAKGGAVNISALKPETLACGTTACACGFAGIDPWFNEQGFYLKPYQGFSGQRFEPAYKGREGWEAVEEFFGLSKKQATKLFSVSCYWCDEITPQDVINRIESLLKENGHA